MTRERLLELYWPLAQSISNARDRLGRIDGPSYDEEYKVQEWHPELTEAAFACAIEHVRRLHEALDLLGLH